MSLGLPDGACECARVDTPKQVSTLSVLSAIFTRAYDPGYLVTGTREPPAHQ